MDAALEQAKTNRVVLDLGLKVPNAVAYRRDIDQFMLDDPIAFNLFLLALRKLQGLPANDALSYFQIAGIHGLPAKDWDSVRGPGSQFTAGGYCTHGMLTFPSWHRPYVAQLEQAVIKAALDIVKSDFPSSSIYQQAAGRIRLPFWDPYRPRGGQVNFPGVGGTTSFPFDFKLPRILTEEQVMVLSTERDTKLTQVANPLFRFNFPSAGGLSTQEWNWLRGVTGEQFFKSWTARNPDNSDLSNSDTAALNLELNRDREGLVGVVVNLLTIPAYKDWRSFSNHTSQAGLARGSLEGFHDQYHGILGGEAGHMSTPPVAAFDPVFWLHHCNVDRLFAIWQAVNPRVWWPLGLRSGEPRSSAPLTPFRHSAGNSDWWTSDSSRRCSDFGYTYPDLDITDSNALAQDIARRYNWSRQGFFPRGQGPTIPSDMAPRNVSSAAPFAANATGVPSQLSPRPTTVAGAQGFAADAATKIVETVKHGIAAVSLNPAKDDSAISGKGKAPDEQKPLAEDKPKIPDGATIIRQWYVDSEAKRNALRGTFTVFFFIGPFDDIPATYKSQPSFAGMAHFFIAPPQACDNCMRQGEAGAIVSNTTTITPILSDYVHKGHGELVLSSLQPEDVKPFLIKNLKWRVLKTPGPDEEVTELKPVPIDQIDGFKIHINSDVSYVEEGSYLPVPVGEEGEDYDDIVGEIDNGM